MNVDRYFARIGYTGPPTATHRTLAAIHRQHMLTVPFENLDIPLGRRISLSPEALWNKMIVERRGGFCYELNTLFGHLLQALGYRVEFLSARVWNGSQWGPDKDHMALRVEADAGSWLADVGFGESFLVPLRLESDLVQEAGFTSFRLLKDDDGWIMQAQRDPDQWDHGYRFTLESHAPESFREMCNYQQTSPDTTFTQRVVCSRATLRGRVSVAADRVILTEGGVRQETPLADAASFRAALAEHHAIEVTLDEAAAIVAWAGTRAFSAPTSSSGP